MIKKSGRKSLFLGPYRRSPFFAPTGKPARFDVRRWRRSVWTNLRCALNGEHRQSVLDRPLARRALEATPSRAPRRDLRGVRIWHAVAGFVGRAHIRAVSAQFFYVATPCFFVTVPQYTSGTVVCEHLTVRVHDILGLTEDGT